MKTNMIEANMRVRSYLLKPSTEYDEDDDEQFAQDVLTLLPGPVDLKEIEALRRSELSTEEIRRRRAANTYNPHSHWRSVNLKHMQRSSKPMSNRSFCLRALAFAWDSGVDINRGPRLHAVKMALHRRAKGGLGKLGAELLSMVWEKSVE